MREITEESYWTKVLSRLNVPGLILLILGAVLVYASSPIAGRIKPEKKESVSLMLKGIGCVIALIGTLILLFA